MSGCQSSSWVQIVGSVEIASTSENRLFSTPQDIMEEVYRPFGKRCLTYLLFFFLTLWTDNISYNPVKTRNNLTPSPLFVINVKNVLELLSYEKLWHGKLVGT